VQAFEQGFRAYVAGSAVTANPFERQSEDGRRWTRGWRTAELVQAKQMTEEDIEAGLGAVLDADRWDGGDGDKPA